MRLDSIRLLLDVEAMAERIGRIPALQSSRIADVRLLAVWVKPYRHFHAAYEVSLDRPGVSGLWAAAFALDPHRARRAAAEAGPHRASLPAASCPHCCTWESPPGVLVQLFPFDYRLPTLVACADPSRVTAALHQEHPAAAISHGVPISYRPGMRCVIRYRTTAGAVLYGKLAVEREPGRAFALQARAYAACAGDDPACIVPQPLAYLPALGLTLLHEAPGTSLHALLRDDAAAGPATAAAARALGRLHGLPLSADVEPYRVADEVALVTAWVSLIADLFPGLAGDLHRAEAAVRGSAPEPTEPATFVHRDYYDKQVQLSAAGATVLDLDTARRGDPEIDAGNFCAHLRLRGLQRACSRRYRTLEEEFLAAYPLPLRADRLAWYRAAALLRLACVYALRPGWRHLVRELAAEARVT